MTTKSKVPQIRFKGFSGEWEEKVLIDIANFINEKILLNELTLSNYISTENLLQNFRGVLISSKLPNSKTVTQFKINDILISNIRPYLKKVWSATFNGGASNDVLVVRAKGDIKNHFLTYFLKNEKFINYIMEGTKGVKMPRGDISLIKKYSLFISLDSNEQTKIGNYFQNLDKLIEQKEKKHKKLEQLKKAMLEKMFPKDGEDTPEIRFKGFSGEWEEKKLNKLINYIIDNRGKNPTYYSKDGIPIIDNFMIKNSSYPNLKEATRFIDDNLFSNFIRQYIEFNDTLITLVGNGIGNITLCPKKRSIIIQNTLGLRFSTDKVFMFYYLLSINSKIKFLNRGMAQPSIRQDELLDLDIKLPLEQKEQIKIGNYFQKLDKLIDLQLQELEKLKNIKKASLDKMFV